MNAAAGHVLRRFLYVGVCLAVPVQADSPARITVDAGDVGPSVNSRMYGIFLEEINHGVDGRLYAEMIRNRGFEDRARRRATISLTAAGSTRADSTLASANSAIPRMASRFGRC